MMKRRVHLSNTKKLFDLSDHFILLANLLGVLGQSRIANNINQLARAANSGSLPVNEEVIKALEDALESVHWMRTTLIKGMGIKPQGEDGENPDDS